MNGSKAKLFMEMKTALYFLYNQILEYYPQELQIAQLIQIFNIYVQGSAIVGLQSQGFNVELPDSQVMSIGNFLLEGPFIGFRGFVRKALV